MAGLTAATPAVVMAADKPEGEFEWVDAPVDSRRQPSTITFAALGPALGILVLAYRGGDIWLAAIAAGFAALFTGFDLVFGRRIARASQQRVKITDTSVRAYTGSAMQWHLSWSQLEAVRIHQPRRVLGVSLSSPVIQFHTRRGQVHTVPLASIDASVRNLVDTLTKRL